MKRQMFDLVLALSLACMALPSLANSVEEQRNQDAFRQRTRIQLGKNYAGISYDVATVYKHTVVTAYGEGLLTGDGWLDHSGGLGLSLRTGTDNYWMGASLGTYKTALVDLSVSRESSWQMGGRVFAGAGKGPLFTELGFSKVPEHKNLITAVTVGVRF